MIPSALHPLLRRALVYVDEGKQTAAAQLAVLSEGGYGDREVASILGVSWFAMNDLRLELQSGVVQVLRIDGYSDEQITVGLRVASEAIRWPAEGPRYS